MPFNRWEFEYGPDYHEFARDVENVEKVGEFRILCIKGASDRGMLFFLNRRVTQLEATGIAKMFGADSAELPKPKAKEKRTIIVVWDN